MANFIFCPPNLGQIRTTDKSPFSKIMRKLRRSKLSYGTPITLQFHLVEAINFPDTCDSYVVLSVKAPESLKIDKGITAKSSTMKKKVNPKWNETVSLSGAWLTEENFQDTNLVIQVFVGKDVNLTHVTRFLDADFFQFKQPSQKTQIIVELNEPPSSKWTPELLASVNRLILEVRAGKSEDVRKLLGVVKRSTVSEVHLLDFDGSMAMEEGMSALKGSTNIKSFLYTDDDGTPNQILIDALIDLTTDLPALETLNLSLGQKLWKSPLVTPLLKAASKLKIEQLLLHDIPCDVELDFASLLSEIAVENLELRFKQSWEKRNDTFTNTFNSLVTGLKACKLPILTFNN